MCSTEAKCLVFYLLDKASLTSVGLLGADYFARNFLTMVCPTRNPKILTANSLD